MKRFGRFIIFISSVVLLFACDGMNDIQQKYLDMAETNYIGKPLNLTFYNGYKRVTVAWRLNSDPKISKCIITWNDGNDKEEVALNSQANDSVTHSIALAEGSYNFKVYQENDKGETSLVQTGSAISYGDTYATTLSKRPFSMDLAYPKCTLNWGSADDAVKSIITYTTTDGKTVNRSVPADSTATVLSGFKVGSTFTVKTGYVLDQTLDTIYSSAETGVFPDYVIPSTSSWKILFCNSDGYFYGTDVAHSGARDADHAGAPAMIDGDINTYWQWSLDGDWYYNINGGDDLNYNFTDYYGCYGDRSDDLQIIVIDMKQSRNIIGVGITQPQDLYGCLKSAKFFVSDDASFKFVPYKQGGNLSDYNAVALNNWTQLFEYDGIPSQKNTCWKEISGEDILNGGIKGRFLKIAIISGSMYGTHGSRIAEVQVMQLNK
jgi:hypothetical protein